ncbi:MAG: hypothetical protein J5U19_15640 [Candidatus Methanoperedens sp.]|nr:hypothetical protein [Candidatus Methanoperedens sp.]
MSESIRISKKKLEAVKEDRTSQARTSEYSQPVNSSVDRILFLQKTVGNQAVGRLMKSGILQAKLRVGQLGDIYEQEADRVADQMQQSGEWGVGPAQSISKRSLVPGRQSTTEVIACQPASGWSGAPSKDPNSGITTVDEKGNIRTDQAASKGVWRVPVEGLKHGLQKGDKGSAFESPKGRAVALIPNMVKAVAPDPEKNGNVPVDVLLHLHGYGVGYRQLKKPGEHDYAGVLEAGQLRDVDLYQMEQQLLSHAAASKRLIVAVLPQGSEKSDFGDLDSKSGDYLKEVFSKLIPMFLPEKAIPGRIIVSGHSGGGPRAMAIALQLKLKDVLLFDAINFKCTETEEKTDKPLR